MSWGISSAIHRLLYRYVWGLPVTNLFGLIHRRNKQLTHSNRIIYDAAQAWRKRTVDKVADDKVQLTLNLADYRELQRTLGR